MSSRLISFGVFHKRVPSGSKASAVGLYVGHPCGSISAICAPPSHGTWALPLRPEWPICMAGTASMLSMNALIGATACICASFHRPTQPGLILPSGLTAVASQMISAAPPIARAPKWWRCQSFMTPSIAEYWHIGAIPIRFFRVISLICNELKSAVIAETFLGLLQSAYHKAVFTLYFKFLFYLVQYSCWRCLKSQFLPTQMARLGTFDWDLWD